MTAILTTDKLMPMKIRFFLICLLLAGLASAQGPVEKRFFNGRGEITDSLNARTYAVIEYQDEAKKAARVTYYTIQGLKKREIHYSNVDAAIMDGPYRTYHVNGQLMKDLFYKNNLLEGPVTTYYDNGVVRRKDIYKEGNFISGQCFTASGQDTLHFDYEKRPEYPGGEAKLMKIISDSIRYPVLARENGIEGEVLASFVVNAEGDVEDVTIVRSPHKLFSAEVLRVIPLTGKWIPGEVDGYPVRVRYNLPVKFKLEGRVKKKKEKKKQE
jgi:TonB family protein